MEAHQDQVKKTKKEKVNILIRVILFLKRNYAQILVIILAAIGGLAAFSHKWYDKPDEKYIEVRTDYDCSLKNRNDIAKLRFKLTNDLRNGKITYEEFMQNAYIIDGHNKAREVRNQKKKPLNDHIASLKVGNWDNTKKLLQFIGIPLFAFIGFLLFNLKRVFKMNDKRSEIIFKWITYQYLAIPIFFFIQTILFVFDKMVDYKMWVYNLVAGSLALIIAFSINKFMNWVYFLNQLEIENLITTKYKLLQVIGYSKKDVINPLAKAVDKDYKHQVKDLLNDYNVKLMDSMEEIAKRESKNKRS